MALTKETSLPGTKIQVITLKSKTSGIIIPTSAPSLLGITGWIRPGIDISFVAKIGDILEIIKKPRKIFQSINCCRVKTEDGIEGEVYWTELKGNCELWSLMPSETK